MLRFNLKVVGDSCEVAETLRMLAEQIDKHTIHSNCIGGLENSFYDYYFSECESLHVDDSDCKVVDPFKKG